MNFRRLSTFILLAGFLVFAYGLFVMGTNQPIRARPNTGNVFKDIEQSIAIIGDNIYRETKREEAKKNILIGCITIFVGVAVRSSSKRENMPAQGKNIIAAITEKLNFLPCVGGLLIVISFLLPFYECHSPSSDIKETGFSELIRGIGRVTYSIEDGSFGRPENRGIAKGGHFVEMTSQEAILLDSLDATSTVAGWATLLGGITSILAFIRHKHVALVAFVTGACGLLHSLRYLWQYTHQVEQLTCSFESGLLVFLIGVACMLTAASISRQAGRLPH